MAEEAVKRLTDWTPLDLKGKPMYAGHDERQRMAAVRGKITEVRKRWNDPNQCDELAKVVEKAVRGHEFPRKLRQDLCSLLRRDRYWADQRRPEETGGLKVEEDETSELYALQLYTTNDGYKRIFGHINQIFRLDNVSEHELAGAVALVELLTIDLYNLRLSNIGSAKYNNFQGIVHRGLSVDAEVLKAFQDLLKKPVTERNFSVPLSFVSTSTDQKNIQEFLNKTERGKTRLHWKIHVHELDPHLLSQYRLRYPESVVTSICAMPISSISEYANEQEILLRGPVFQVIREYKEAAEEHDVNVVEMIMLNANRDHGSELAQNEGDKALQRTYFGMMIGASKYEICANLCRSLNLGDAEEYRKEAEKKLADLKEAGFDAPFAPNLSETLSAPRRSWLGSQLERSFTPFYVARRNRFSIASNKGSWGEVKEIIDQEYDWQQSDWCNITRLYEHVDDTARRSGFSVLHQAAFNNAPLSLIKKLINLGAWRTLKASAREEHRTPLEVALLRGHTSLKEILSPVIHHIVSDADLMKLQAEVHDLMRALAGDLILNHAICLPQLSVMTEMDESTPSLWVPIPGMHGGFIIDLNAAAPLLEVQCISHNGAKKERISRITVDGIVTL